jgi:uncharacterized membrane protein HdeD (DUF308 family)
MASNKLSGNKALMWTGIALIGLGVFVLLSPAAVGGAVVRIVALVLVVTGVAYLVNSLRQPAVVNKTIGIFLGGLVAGVGVLVWLNPELGSGFLTALLMIFFAIDGVWKLTLTVRYHRASGWYWLLLAGLLSLVLLWMLWLQYPLQTAWAVSVFVGLDLLATGVALVLLARSVRTRSSSDYLDTISL